MPDRLINFRTIIQEHLDVVSGYYFYRMYQLPDHFLVPLLHVVAHSF